ncbi:MAG: hypothetical protein C0597_06090 [Marinilabiliales bacterium]|nr:MAG: hypothetical protein C0597_06090 [Marinilabiliales bacterium]
MPQLDRTGPENKGSKTGRRLGMCKSSEKSDSELGKGMGLRRKSAGGYGLGKRLRSTNIFTNNLK